jgi:hypothetical protein
MQETKIEVENTVEEPVSAEIKDPVAVLAALERAKSDAKKFREEKEALEVQMKEFNEKSSAVKRKLMDEKVNKYLSEKGIKNADRLLKYIKFDEVDLTEDFEVVGLQDQIDSLRVDLPELFDPKVVLGGQADSGSQSSVDAPVTASEIQARMILGRN